MKNILIGGVPRSGKSALANLLVEHHRYSVLRGDKIMSALVRTHPEINITHKPTDPAVAVSERTPYMFALLRKLTLDDTVPYVLDSTLLLPDDVRQHPDIANLCTPVFLGYPSVSVDAKVQQILAHAPGQDCLSHELSESELKDWVERWISESNALRTRCAAHGYKFIDTSESFRTTLLDACNEIAGESQQTDGAVTQESA